MWPWRRPPSERDVDDEIAFHLAEEARLRVERGVPPDEASAAAHRAFGNVTLVREVTRDTWSTRAVASVMQDVRLGLRLLARHRLFAVFSIVSLALGIGGTSAVFSLYDAIVLRPLPVHEPGQLVTLSIHADGRQANSFMPFRQFEAMRQGNQSLTGMFARTGFPMLSVGAGGTQGIASAMAATGAYHETLGVRPAIGRLLTAADDTAGAAPVVVLSHAYWRRAFEGRATVLGQTITLNRVPFTVVGVEPAGFFGVTVGLAPDLTMPMRASARLRDKEPPWDDAFGTWIEVMGRLRPGVPLERATEELDGIFRQVSLDAARDAAPDSDDARFARDTHIGARPGGTGGVSSLRRRYESGLQLMLALLGGVLVLASLNVGALLLSRSEARRDEIAIRLALGAGRARVLRQLLTESAVIAAGGGALGLLVAWRGSEALLRLALPSTTVLPIDLAPDLRIVAFTSLVSIAGCLVFGLLPAVRTTASAPASSRGEVGGRRRRWVDRALVMSQTAVALVLVVTAGLFVNSLRNLWAQDTGYDRSNVLMFSIDARLAGQRDLAAMQTYQRVLEQLRAYPAARSVSVSTVRPVSSTYYLIDRVTSVGDSALSSDAAIRVAFNQLGPGYFQTLGIRLVAGRDFEWRDGPDAPPVAIISEQLAKHFVGNPVGQRFTFGGDDVREVIGVAADSRYARITDAPREVVYLPYFEQGTPRFTPTYEMKYAGTTADAVRAAAEAVARVDSSLTLFTIRTLEAETRDSLARERMLAGLTTYFGAFAWLLAGIGLYGLLTCTVAQRTREFGLRMALGASPGGIGLAVLRESAGTIAVGLLAGVGLSLLAVRLVRTQLYGVAPVDSMIVAGAVLVLLALGVCASFVPARRASRIDPMSALRQE